MMQVTTPVPGYTGEVAGVHFIDGVGETSDARAIAYFARRGYSFEDATDSEEPVVEEEPAEAPVEDATDSEEPVVEEEPASRGRRRS